MKDISLMIEDIKFNYRVGLLIDNGDEVFIERNRLNDYAVLPGGRVKTMEDSVNALKREIKEEMDIELNDKIVMQAFIENFFNMDNTNYHEIYILYRINVSKDDKRFINMMPNIDSDSNYYEWIRKDELKDKVVILPEVINKIIFNKKFINVVLNDL